MHQQYRGSILSVIAKDFVERGAAGFVYIGEIATFHAQLVGRVVAPSEFRIEPAEFWLNATFLWKKDPISPKNINLNHHDYGFHYSSPQFFDLSRREQQLLLQNGVTTIDDSISYLATTIASLDKPEYFFFAAVSQVTALISFDKENQIPVTKNSNSNSSNAHITALLEHLASTEFNPETKDHWLSALSKQHPLWNISLTPNK